MADDNRSCIDIDECAVDNICGNGDCINNQGSYSCLCHEGYQTSQHGDNCEDINECIDKPCGRGECVNSPGTYECFCQPGYAFDGLSCFDLDEVIGKISSIIYYMHYDLLTFKCFIGNPCVNGNCSNKDGGYDCDCFKGFYQEDGVCLDINECTSFSHNPCGAGQCINTEGDYECQCPEGYQHSDAGCHDIDEVLTSVVYQT